MIGFIIILSIFLIFISINLVLVRRNKKKYKEFKKRFHIGNSKNFERKKVVFEANGFDTSINRADIIFSEASIFIIPVSKIIGTGLIIQLSEDKSPVTYPEVAKIFHVESKHRVQNKLRIKGSFKTAFSQAEFKVSIDFEYSQFDLDILLCT